MNQCAGIDALLGFCHPSRRRCLLRHKEQGLYSSQYRKDFNRLEVGRPVKASRRRKIAPSVLAEREMPCLIGSEPCFGCIEQGVAVTVTIALV
jgi:hypothetical protein